MDLIQRDWLEFLSTNETRSKKPLAPSPIVTSEDCHIISNTYSNPNEDISGGDKTLRFSNEPSTPELVPKTKAYTRSLITPKVSHSPQLPTPTQTPILRFPALKSLEKQTPMASESTSTVRLLADELKKDVDTEEEPQRVHTGSLEQYIAGFCSRRCITYNQLVEELWHNRAKTPIKSEFWQGLRTPNMNLSTLYKQVKRRMCRAPKWLPENDVQLKILVREHGESQWARIGRIMNIPSENCRDRWRNYLICGENRVQKQWSNEETALLHEAVKKCIDLHQKILWPKVSALMNYRRSRLQCRNKWKILYGVSSSSSGFPNS